jgi:GT2 family glycosyltransferase/glycosyltransferase involved in cell wall biosynthesis
MRVLQVSHGFPPAASAGTEVYVRNLACTLSRHPSDEVRVLTRDADPRRRELDVREWLDGHVRVTAINNNFQSCLTFEDSYRNGPIEELVGRFLDAWRPDVVHLQHLTCLSTGIPRQAVHRGVPVVMTLNDYWLICHRGQLVDLTGARCDGPFDGGCARCIDPAALANEACVRAGRAVRALPFAAGAVTVQAAAGVIRRVRQPASTRPASRARLEHMRAAVADVDVFLAPSATLAARFERFGIPRQRLIRSEQGIVLPMSKPSRRGVSMPLRLGFAGGLQPTKGLHVLLEAIERLPSNSITLDVFGSVEPYHGDDNYMSYLGRRLEDPAVRSIGPVPHERMAQHLSGLDVLVVPSIWIENAPFIIREAFAAGVPVIASDLGGMAEMVHHEKNGLLFAVGDSAALVSAIRRVVDDPTLIDSLRAGIARPVSIEEDAERLRRVYGSIVRKAAKGSETAGLTASATDTAGLKASTTERATGARVAAVVLNYQTADQTCIAVQSLRGSRTPPTGITIVDNGSADESLAVFERNLRGVAVMALAENRGFSAGCNAGIRRALESSAELVLLVNSDVVLRPDALNRLLHAVRDPRIGIAGPVLLSREEPDRIASAGISFSATTGRMCHRAAGSRLAALDPVPHHGVDAVSGCVMLVKREVFEQAGLLDDAYFYSFEDVDLCLRARRAGFRTVCVHDAIAYHEGGRTIGRRSARRVYFATRNHLRLATRRGTAFRRHVRTGCVLGLNAAYVLVSPEAPLVSGAAAFVRGAWHHFTGRYGPD